MLRFFLTRKQKTPIINFGELFWYKMTLHLYRNSHYKDKTVSQPLYLMEIPYTLTNGLYCYVLESLATLTLGSSKINQHCWRFHGSGVIAAPQIIGLISFCTGMHHEYFFEVVNVLLCYPFMFENAENKQLDWRIRHSHLASTLFHSLVPWWRPRRIRPQITRLSQLENSAMGTWPIYENSLYYTRLVRKMAWYKILIQVLIV